MPLFSNVEIHQFPLWDKLRSRRVPLAFDLEITARCNNNCRHCYINLPPNDPDARRKELTVAEIEHLADESVQLGALWCLITGGEPLLRDDFEEIYIGLKRKGLLVSVFTNVTMIGRKHVDLFKKYPPRDIEATVYGLTGDTYERISRKPGSFSKFMSGLDMLLSAGVPVRLKAIAIRSNFDEQARIAEFCRSRTKDYYRFDPQLHLRFDRDTERNKEILEERLTPEQILSLEVSDSERMRALRKQCTIPADEEQPQSGSDRLFHCSAGLASFSVSYDGKFRLCSSLCAPGTTYDLRKGTLSDAWNNFLPRVREMRSENRDFIETCRKCALADLCLSCPAHAYLECGEMDGPTPYFCSVARERACLLRPDSFKTSYTNSHSR